MFSALVTGTDQKTPDNDPQRAGSPPASMYTSGAPIKVTGSIFSIRNPRDEDGQPQADPPDLSVISHEMLRRLLRFELWKDDKPLGASQFSLQPIADQRSTLPPHGWLCDPDDPEIAKHNVSVYYILEIHLPDAQKAGAYRFRINLDLDPLNHPDLHGQASEEYYFHLKVAQTPEAVCEADVDRVMGLARTAERREAEAAGLELVRKYPDNPSALMALRMCYEYNIQSDQDSEFMSKALAIMEKQLEMMLALPDAAWRHPLRRKEALARARHDIDHLKERLARAESKTK